MLTLVSPAKINLFLRVLHRRNDGYHELASLFQTISLFDTLHFELSDHDQLTCSDTELLLDRSNLVWKAVDLFRRKTGKQFAIRIHLDKQIPTQAGLGGGSSNAATTLWALNQLHSFSIPHSTLIDWASEIGSDIPFFLTQGTAYCTGRGEKVQSLPALPALDVWIVKPEFGLSTPEVYRNVEVSQLPNRDPIKALHGHHYFNDLEDAAFKVKPELASLKAKLQNGFKNVLLAGSGSSFICFGDGKAPTHKNLLVRKATFVNRMANEWYKKCP